MPPVEVSKRVRIFLGRRQTPAFKVDDRPGPCRQASDLGNLFRLTLRVRRYQALFTSSSPSSGYDGTKYGYIVDLEASGARKWVPDSRFSLDGRYKVEKSRQNTRFRPSTAYETGSVASSTPVHLHLNLYHFPSISSVPQDRR